MATNSRQKKNFRCKKKRHHDRLAALIALSSSEYKSKSNSAQAQRRNESRVYQCKLCGGWHITSR